MFSPPPTRLRRHIRPYKLAPIEREMYVQETISDSPFYSTTAAYSSDYSSKLPPISSPAPSSIPMLIMTDDGGDDWEVLSEVSGSDGFQSGDPIENDYYDDDIFEEPSDDEESESLNDTYPSSDFEPNDLIHHIPPAIRYQRASSPSLSRSSGRRSRLIGTASEPSESSSLTKSSKITSSYASNTPRTANNSANSSNADSGIQKEVAVKPQYNSFVVSPPESDLYNTELKSTSRASGGESESESRSTRSETVTETVTRTGSTVVSETVNTETGILIESETATTLTSAAKNTETTNEETENSIMRSKSKSPLPPERPSASWGFEKVNGHSDYDSDPGIDRRRIHATPGPDDEGYDSSKERRRQFLREKKRKAKIRTSLENGLDMVGVESRVRQSLNNYRAIRMSLYKNGDPWYGPIKYHFLPGRDVTSLDSLFRAISPKMDLLNGVSYMFDTEGRRITSLEQIQENGIYICSTSKKFIPGSYGGYGGMDNFKENSDFRHHQQAPSSPPPAPRAGPPTNIFRNKVSSAAQSVSSESSGGGVRSGGKPSSGGDGKIITIINADQQEIRERVLLNLKTTQPFDEVVRDLGQVLKIRKARMMVTKDGLEVRGFNHLRGVYANQSTFLLSAFRNKVVYEGSDDEDEDGSHENLAPSRATPLRRNSDPIPRKSSRAPSRTLSDQGRRSPARVATPAEETGGTDAIKVTIKGDRKLFWPPAGGYRKIIARPKSRLVLDWVYGCRGTDVTRNLWLSRDGELVYFVSTTVVIYNRLKETQRHYRGHTEEITCMDIHAKQNLGLSGQKNGRTHDSRAHIRLWDFKSLETLVTLGYGEYELKVAGVAFSYSESSDVLLAGIDGGGEDHVLSVWQWDNKAEKAPLLGRVATRGENLRGVTFHPLDNHLVITFGKGHLVFWNRRKDGFFDRNDLVEDERTVSCMDFLESGDVVVGDDAGAVRTYSVSVEGEYYMSHEFEAHPKGVNAILALGDGTVVTGGEKDRKLTTWDSTRDFNKRQDIKLPDGVGSVRSLSKQSVDQSERDLAIYIGTTKNCILEGSASKKTFKIAVWGHSNKLEAVAAHPDDLAFVTAGFDKVVAKWRKQKVLWKVTTQSELISAAYHPSANTVVAGSLDGYVVVLNGETGVHVTTVRVCAAPLNDLKFNRTGSQFACAAQTGLVHIFRTSQDGYTYKRDGKLALSNIALITLDWSEDSHSIAAVTADFNLVHADVKLQRLERKPEYLRDQTWLDQTCTLGYNVAGTWNNLGYKNDPTTTTAVHIGNHRTKVISGDAQGNLRMFQYPCTTPRAEFIEEKTASTAIVAMRFLFEDMYAITVGGSDATLLRWKIV